MAPVDYVLSLALFFWCTLNPLEPKSDQHQNVISPNSNTAESFIKITRIKEMIANLWNLDC